jgi:hypothetical protein
MRPELRDLKPSTQNALAPSEVVMLPDGMIVVRDDYKDPSGYPLSVFRVCRGGNLAPLTAEGTWGDPWKPDHWAELRLPRLPRLSCNMTVPQVLDRSKMVTRRLHRPKWVEPGRLVLLVDKIRAPRARGLAVVELVGARREELRAITPDEVRREGFPEMDPQGFVDLFCAAQGSCPEDSVWRFEWRYL